MESKTNRTLIILQFVNIAISLLLFFLGGSIYLLFRDKSLKMFSWAETLGIDSCIDKLRFGVENYHPVDFVVYALPDGLWLLSYILLVGTLWEYNLRNSLPFMVLLPIVALGSEFLQFVGCLRGTPDIADIVAYSFSIIIGITYLYFIRIFYDKKIN